MHDPTHIPDYGPSPEPDDLQFEVTSLAPDRPHTAAPAFLGAGSSNLDRVARATLAAGAVLLALALVFGGISSYRALLASARPTPTAVVVSVSNSVVISSVNGSSTVATPGGVANCPPGNTIQSFAPGFQPGAGVYGLSVYFIGFDGPQANLHLAGAASTPHGWAEKLVLAAASDVSEPLTLSARGIGGAGNGPLWLSASGPDQAALALTFDPSTQPTSTGWTVWPFQLYVPAGGCYFLQVLHFKTATGTYFSAGQ
jgi:hypothetical protein